MAEADDAAWFAERLREADRQELTAASGPDIEGNLREAIDRSLRRAFVASSTAFGPLSLFGFVPAGLLSSTAIPWMVGTDDIRRRARALNRFGRLYCGAALDEFDLLVNYVDARHAESIRWLKRLGFTFGEPVPFGVQGLPFLRFEMGKDRV